MYAILLVPSDCISRSVQFISGPGPSSPLFHDVLVTIGVISLLDGLTPLTNFELDLSMIAALLTLTGLSVNDTVVIFDRIGKTNNATRRWA